MSLIYKTNEYKGHGSGKSYSWNEYEQDGDTVTKYRCNRTKFFDGDENTWSNSRKEEASWEIGDDDMPDWLNNYTE